MPFLAPVCTGALLPTEGDMHRVTKIIIAGLALVALAAAGSGCGATASDASHDPAMTPRPVANDVGSKRLGAPGDPAGHPQIRINYVQGVGPAPPPNWTYNFYLYNYTPYVWTLDPTETTNLFDDAYSQTQPYKLKDWEGAAPPQTLQPGQVMHLEKVSGSAGSCCYTESWVGYTFTDDHGVRHLAQMHAQPNANGDNLYAYSNDWKGSATTGGWYDSIDVFHMHGAPGAPLNNSGAFMSHPVDINIDAKSNPDGAAQVLSYFQDSDPTTRSFKPTAAPSWTQSDPVPGSARLINTSSAEAELTASTGTTNTESTSLSEKLSWELEVGLFDVANAGVNASIESGQEWSTSNEAENGNRMTVHPCQQGWFIKQNQVQSVTGDFDFAIPAWQVTYHVTNATFSVPGLTHNGADGIPIPGTSFTSHTEEIAPSSCPTS
jgi:hypothetical protein